MSADEVFSRMAATLDRAGIPFMLTGSFASSLHGVVRATQDIDLVIAPTAEQLRELVADLPADEYYVDLDAALEALRRQTQFNIIDLSTGWKIDLVIRRDRAFSRQEFDRRQPVEYADVRLHVATAEDVIIAKLEGPDATGDAARGRGLRPRAVHAPHAGEQALVIGRGLLVGLLVLAAACVRGDDDDRGPSFDCAEAEGSVEELICADAELAALDRELAAVWQEVLARADDDPDLPTYRAMQRGWVKGRNDCWKGDDLRACVVDAYRRRTAELQARWRLVAARGPVFYTCDENPANEVVATFFATDPPVAILERGDRSVVCFREPTASGARYAGPDITFWIQGDAATLVWGFEAEALACVVRGVSR